jgi:branched-chain amino acid transport system permease protein
MKKDLRNLAIFLIIMGSLPFWALNTVYSQGVLIRALIYVGLAQSWNIITGLGGQLSFGHACFLGIGGYTSGLLFENFGLTPWIGVFVGIGAAVLFSFLIGYPCFRLTGIYFALASFTVSLILEVLARHFDKLTGGDVGLSIRLLGDAPAYFQFSNPKYYYIIGLAIVSFYFLITRWIMDSRFGYYLKAIRDDQGAAECMGVDSARVKLIAFAISAFMAALVGTFYVQYNLFIDPAAAFGMNQSVQILLVSIAGGIGTLWGPIVGGLFIIPVGEITNALFGKGIPGIDVLVFGAILLVIILYIPRGLISLPSLFRKK